MLEIYLFVNPLGTKCFKSEQKVLDFIRLSPKKISFQFVPMLNIQTVNDVMIEKNLDTRNLTLRNELSESIYQAALDYKAALFQGKKRGRAFLMAIQEYLVQDSTCYSEELIQQVAKEVNLNWKMFSEDRRSVLAKNSFKNDQKIANDMNVTMHPTIVINNIDGLDCGVSFPDADLVDISKVCAGDFNIQNGLHQTINPQNQLYVL
ncbi:DsbA family protein [Dellaglioa sp. P0083]|uniref:DsbA family protein n=1 Tax=Dellaglioa kimchii TaxID=3344667 RepID=UPI0038D42D42